MANCDVKLYLIINDTLPEYNVAYLNLSDPLPAAGAVQVK